MKHMTGNYETAGISESEKLGLFEECLNSGLDLRVRVTGKSMSPFLRGGEMLTIKKVPPHTLRKGDLILFLTDNGSPVLHRIIRFRQSPGNARVFHTKGDALYGFDEPVHEAAVLGKVLRVERESRHTGENGSIDMDSFFRRRINYLVAVTSLVRGKCILAFSRIAKRIKPVTGT
jgi:signal peptidase I